MPTCRPVRSISEADLRSLEDGDLEGVVAVVVVVEVAEKNEGKASKELKSNSIICSSILS